MLAVVLNDANAIYPVRIDPTPPGNLLYLRAARGKPHATFMDVFWSIFTMPIGVALCFGPAILVWWLTDDKNPPPTGRERHD